MKKTSVFALSLALLMVSATVVSVFAKDFNNMPEGAIRNYWTGGTGRVEVPETWPVGGRHYSLLVVYAQHVEAGTYGAGNSITIFVPYSGFVLPMACFCTNADEALFEKALRAGTPAGNLAGNTRSVLESVLKVERHGNDVTVELTTPQTILWPSPVSGNPAVSVTIPNFKIELDEVDGSVHTDTEISTPPGYKVIDDNMGFEATGAFTCSAWSYMAYPMAACKIVMHGINTNVPP